MRKYSYLYVVCVGAKKNPFFLPGLAFIVFFYDILCMQCALTDFITDSQSVRSEFCDFKFFVAVNSVLADFPGC